MGSYRSGRDGSTTLRHWALDHDELPADRSQLGIGYEATSTHPGAVDDHWGHTNGLTKRVNPTDRDLAAGRLQPSAQVAEVDRHVDQRGGIPPPGGETIRQLTRRSGTHRAGYPHSGGSTGVRDASRPHITLQVLPYKVGAHPGMHGAFAVMDFPDGADPELVYIENMAGALYLEKEADIRRYAEMFDQLRAAALNVADSRRLLRRLIDIH
ncbi:Scr1 family TA system antitoxin-like transcriptional regulator [Micromonospora sp. SH-82]|uniref:Scr1 family TA system antitoxin-like transcriptional regulator n=1 Tax=Micromonospora sp. SH-82 TaxID=3132938 RepID=UPI003EB82B77